MKLEKLYRKNRSGSISFLEIFDNILNKDIKCGEVKIKKVKLNQFFKENFPEIRILNIPFVLIKLILIMPKKILFNLPIDLIHTAYNEKISK